MVIPPGSSFVTESEPFEATAIMGGRVVSVSDKHVQLAEVVEIMDPWTISPMEILLSPKALIQKPKKRAMIPTGNPETVLTVPFASIRQPELMTLGEWQAYRKTCFQKPAPVDFSFNVAPGQ